MSAESRLAPRFAAARSQGRTALVPYLMAGFPHRRGFAALVERVAAHADVLELGLPFSDPSADGPAIAAAARAALADGVTLEWTCALAAELGGAPPLVLMSYLNPLLAPGLERSLDRLAAAGFAGLIVPDVPLEESGSLRALAAERALDLVQLVTPLTPPPRARRIAEVSRGFLYAVTRAGTTGPRAEPRALAGYLARLRALAPLPVCAGFGLRDPEQVRDLSGKCDGAVVGSALIERLARGEDPVALLESLSAAAAAGAAP